MAFDLDTVQKLINSPPGQLMAGAALAGIVWKFFEKVEGILSDNTKFEIAVWLIGVEAGKRVEPWPATFASVFQRAFGVVHFSFRCAIRSIAFSSCVYVIVTFFTVFDAANLVERVSVLRNRQRLVPTAAQFVFSYA